VNAEPEFERFYRAEMQPVFIAVFLLCGNAGVAEEATQEAFARAWERWDRLGREQWVGGWVTTTAINVARRVLRRRPILERTGQLPDPEASTDLWATVRTLPRRQQEAVVLYYRLDLPVREIAKILGCREGTVRTHLARAREALRTALRGTIDGYRREDQVAP